MRFALFFGVCRPFLNFQIRLNGSPVFVIFSECAKTTLYFEETAKELKRCWSIFLKAKKGFLSACSSAAIVHVHDHTTEISRASEQGCLAVSTLAALQGLFKPVGQQSERSQLLSAAAAVLKALEDEHGAVEMHPKIVMLMAQQGERQ